MPFRRIFLGWAISLALYSAKMQNTRTVHLFYVIENSDHSVYIVSVKWSEISDIQALEYILLLAEERFYAIVETQYGTFAAFAYQMHILKQFIYPVSERVIGLCRIYVCQI